MYLSAWLDKRAASANNIMLNCTHAHAQVEAKGIRTTLFNRDASYSTVTGQAKQKVKTKSDKSQKNRNRINYFIFNTKDLLFFETLLNCLYQL